MYKHKYTQCGCTTEHFGVKTLRPFVHIYFKDGILLSCRCIDTVWYLQLTFHQFGYHMNSRLKWNIEGFAVDVSYDNTLDCSSYAINSSHVVDGPPREMFVNHSSSGKAALV